MAKAQHRTPEYRQAYLQLRADQAAGRTLWCVEPVCKLASRDIHPWQRASISHDTTGTRILGPSHLTCNLSEAAVRGNQQRGRRQRRKQQPQRRTPRPLKRWTF